MILIECYTSLLGLNINIYGYYFRRWNFQTCVYDGSMVEKGCHISNPDNIKNEHRKGFSLKNPG